jgi:hypothetical protein
VKRLHPLVYQFTSTPSTHLRDVLVGAVVHLLRSVDDAESHRTSSLSGAWCDV